MLDPKAATTQSLLYELGNLYTKATNKLDPNSDMAAWASDLAKDPQNEGEQMKDRLVVVATGPAANVIEKLLSNLDERWRTGEKGL